MDEANADNELFLLVELTMTGRADQGQIDRLGWLLERDKEAREKYARAWMLDVDLRQVLHSGVDPALQQVEECLVCVPPDTDEILGRVEVGSMRRMQQKILSPSFQLGAAVLVLVGLVGYLLGRGPEGTHSQQPVASATDPNMDLRRGRDLADSPLQSGALRIRLTKASRCVWGHSSEDSRTLLASGVERGESLELLEGFATFSLVADRWQASVQIEGPAAMVVTSDELPALRHGQMLVDIKSSTEPLSIDLPYAEVHLMPGSEVGVVAFGSLCEVHVFRGVASLKSLWNMQSIGGGSADGAFVVPEGSSLAMEARNGNVVSTTESTANRGMFDAAEFMKGGQLVVTKKYVDQVVDANPVAYWRFEEAVDGVVNNTMRDRFALLVHGGLKLDGLTGNRYVNFRLDENADHQRFLYTAEPISPALQGDYSVEFWMNPSHHQTSTLLALVVPEAGRQEPQTTWEGIRISEHGLLIEIGGFSGDRGIMQPRKLRYVHRNPPGTGGGTSTFSTKTYAVREWQHVVCEKEGDRMRAYLNGKLCSEATDSTKLPPELVVVIGQISDARFERSFYGQIDEFAIYNRALREDEIRSHYQAAQFIDHSPLFGAPTSLRPNLEL
ncbi:LamG domain-containing protein [Aeoliella sp. ICT_H6.2]|uniref:LamG domain-containing protein n=1 Tax=Aeoliella straminimaris TaxID=2954799 RepID=A0A9X2JFG6_9BACT|nr:LamG domain-containing protein [Aeoliella straminimaris]MCO6043676.1 LamG domain-containing protein [Aeoliella straminimaris]